MQLHSFSKDLLKWFQTNQRILAWRNTQDPYRILLAEMLLRKTTALQVASVYNRLISRYPNPQKLANSSLRDLQQILKPLGMGKNRPRLLKLMVRVVLDHYKGRIPNNVEELMQLPGVGRYATNAVLCLAHGRDVPMLDANAVRVLTRVYDVKSAKKRGRDDPQMWSLMQKLIPKGQGKSFNLAVLDFASAICTARRPKCQICFAKDYCDYAKKLFDEKE